MSGGQRVKLSRLLETIPDVAQNRHGDPDIGSVHYRSQEVKPGGLFVAVKGFKTDGHDYIDDAVARGAAAILAQKPVKTPGILVQTENTRKALAAISSVFYGRPSETLRTIAVTGTNGKTTTAFLIEGILAQAGFDVGVIGTINYRYSGKTFDNPVTTPESLDLQRILADMKAHGITHVVMEVSSHGIDLFRIHGCWFDAGVFTNLSQDHLDYHKTMDQYWACKKKLFTEILTSGPKKQQAFAAINADDKRGSGLLSTLPIPVLSFGRSPENMIRAETVHHSTAGTIGRISTPAGALEYRSPLVGGHNIENILAAVSVGIGLKLPVDTVKSGIERVKFIPGRLQPVENSAGRNVYVDYAHTPAALEHTLLSLASLSNGKMICVFGCGGDRDKEKRSIMGEIAAKLCDLTVVTSDNPRSEPPMEIIDQVVRGVKNFSIRQYARSELSNGFKDKGFIVEPDRQQAIRLGIMASRGGDTVLVAGKGHETYQIIGSDSFPFNDTAEAAAALESYAAISNKGIEELGD
jgi:UDP-N-acetylmuramoyl-L-alanyl-D-glutamate--2,6-diaminopimelate ligase